MMGSLQLTVAIRDMVARAQAGSLEAFDQLVSIHQARVYALARRILGNDQDAEDVQQEAFVRAWRSLRKFRGNSEFATWLHRITVNVCLTRKQRASKEAAPDTPFDEELGAAHPPDDSDALERAELAVQIRRVMAAMPVHHRAMLVLREIEERPFEEIARILGCSEQSARVRATRARQMLRERMRPYLTENEP